MTKGKAKVGIFDSGFGGITVLKHIVKELPEYHYVYLGDTARAPYGNRPQEMISLFTKEAVTFLFNHGCDLVILACNTASSEALRELQQKFLPTHFPGKRVLGVLIPAAEESVKHSRTKRIGVLATESTVHSGAFIREIKKAHPEAEIIQKAAPLLVPMVEAGEQNLPHSKMMLAEYLDAFAKTNIDVLILGCTHYSVFQEKIQKIVGKNIMVLAEGKIVAQKLKRYLQKHTELEKSLAKTAQVTFFSTDMTERFSSLGSKFFGKTIKVKKISLPTI